MAVSAIQTMAKATTASRAKKPSCLLFIDLPPRQQKGICFLILFFPLIIFYDSQREGLAGGSVAADCPA